jgi:hypothetical protein
LFGEKKRNSGLKMTINIQCRKEKHCIYVSRNLPKSILEFSAGRTNIESMFQESVPNQ